MRTSRRCSLATLTLLVALPACGGRTGTRDEEAKPLVTVGVNDGSDAVPTPAVSTSRPGPTTITATPPSTTEDPVVPFPVGTLPAPWPVEVPSTPVTTPPQATGCPMVSPAQRPSVVFAFTDGTTTLDLYANEGDVQWCASGIATSSGPNYSEGGAGAGLSVGQVTPEGLILPFDAAARGIVGVRFDLAMKGHNVRVQLAESDAPYIMGEDYNFRSNPFIWGGSSPKELGTPGTYEIRFSEFLLPSWSSIPEQYQRPLDASRIESLQFVIFNNPSDRLEEYAFCVSNVQWVDECGYTIESSVLADSLSLANPDPTTTAAPTTTTSTAPPTTAPTTTAPTTTEPPTAEASTSTEDPWTSDVSASSDVASAPSAEWTSDVTFTEEPVAGDAGLPPHDSDASAL